MNEKIDDCLLMKRKRYVQFIAIGVPLSFPTPGDCCIHFDDVLILPIILEVKKTVKIDIHIEIQTHCHHKPIADFI